MANENPENPPGARRQRPPTVIDLPATEVPPEPKEPSEGAASPPPDPPPASPGETDRPAGRRSSGLVGGVFGGTIGGLLAAVLLWWWGAFPARQALPADPGPRLAAIEQQLKNLAARPAPAAVDAKEITKEVVKEVNKAIDEMGGRISRLEAAQTTPRPPVTDPVVLGRLTAGEGASKSLADNVAALSRRAEATDLDNRDREICVALGPELKRRGLIFVGIDVIGGMLTEINVTSPTGIVALDAFNGTDTPARIWDSIERRLADRGGV